jgi:tetratricopeptide (TPR) repeat protein
MSLLRRLFGRSQNNPYAAGIALYEEGRFTEAIDHLREAARQDHSSPAGALASFYLRQAQTAEGRRLLQAGRAAEAARVLGEVAALETTFADVQFLHGAALGFAGQWDDALRAARCALRLNPDYSEARLLEACALDAAGRPREAAASLNDLLESGRRVVNLLISDLAQAGPYTENTVPSDLAARLAASLQPDDHQGELAEAVALCRNGAWHEGIARLRLLVSARPDYPDYRVRLGAALFQVGQIEEALREADAAVARNPYYRNAQVLRALILADQRRLEAAWQLADQLTETRGPTQLATQEDLLLAYLAAVLGLLTGRPDVARRRLEPWGDLTRIFPWAQLLRVALAELSGQSSQLGVWLAALVTAWPNDPDYRHCQVCHQLERGELAAAERALTHWPLPPPKEADPRPLLLAAALRLRAGRTVDIDTLARQMAAAPAVRFLSARSAAASGQWHQAGDRAQALWEDGYHIEPVARLLAAAARELPSDASSLSDWSPPLVLPEAALPDTVAVLHRQGRSEEAQGWVGRHGQLQPEVLRWQWLSADFWLDPIRRWIS